MAKPSFLRSDYSAVFEAGGADALNELLADRYAPDVLARELLRMQRSRFWLVKWDADGNGRVVGRGPGRPIRGFEEGD